MRKHAFCIFLWFYGLFSLLTITVQGVSNKHCLLPFFFHSYLQQYFAGVPKSFYGNVLLSFFLYFAEEQECG